MMTRSTASTSRGDSSRMRQSKSMPMATKKSAENASCSGSDSVAARWANLLPCMTSPAKKAPSAKLT